MAMSTSIRAVFKCARRLQKLDAQKLPHISGCSRSHTRPYSSGGENILSSPFPDVHIPDSTPFAHYVMEHFGRYGDKVALTNGVTGQTYTFAQLQTAIKRVASGLSKLGLNKGDVITLFSPNCPEYAIMFLAATAVGATVSAVNPLYTPDDLSHQLQHSNSRYLVTIPELIGGARQAVAPCQNLKEIIVFGQADGCRPFSNLMEDDGTAFNENIDIDIKDHEAALPYSSGTTGLPKGVMLTHHNLVANISQLDTKNGMDYSEGDSLIGVLPFFHIYGQIVVLFSGLRKGLSNVALPRFDPELYLTSVQKHKATFLHVVPPIALFLAKHPLVDKYDFSSVHTVFTGAAPLGNELAEEVLSRLKVPNFRQGYGLTECSPVTHCNPTEGVNKFGSIGTVIPNTNYKIVDVETGATCGLHENGELCVKGPQVMKGYYKNPEATADTIDKDGWLHTGDIGHYDDDGHCFIVDRLKELIKYKGFQVAPAELEALLLTHPAILDAAVIGVPNLEAGELPRAYIVQKPNMKVSEEEVSSFIESKLAPHKKLRGGVEFRSEIPKSPSGKILRRMLKQELLDSK